MREGKRNENQNLIRRRRCRAGLSNGGGTWHLAKQTGWKYIEIYTYMYANSTGGGTLERILTLQK